MSTQSHKRTIQNTGDPQVFFDEERAVTYDDLAIKLVPLLEAKLLAIRFSLENLPSDARILCVGVGTGTELIHLARCFPCWTFTAVDPAPAMLNVCRSKVKAAGMETRCNYHEGYLDTLPVENDYDAATCLLVSHFILDRAGRIAFFRGIAARLKPGGVLISSDLSSDISKPAYQILLRPWLRMLGHSGKTPEEIEGSKAAYQTQVALLDPVEVETILMAAGFDACVRIYQNLLIHAWMSTSGRS
ncbi:MAG: class I SAM-dependent methyltransferase [Verrucomicrobiota bacterium]